MGGDAHLDAVSYFVLDEADRMLDLGFHEDVLTISKYMTAAKRQLLFFSATWDDRVQALAEELCQHSAYPVRISYDKGGTEGTIAAGEGAGAAPKHRVPDGIVQEVVVVDCPGKKHWLGDKDHWDRQEKIKRGLLDAHLKKVLKASPDHKVLVFVNEKTLVDTVCDRLRLEGVEAGAMHKDKTPGFRHWVLNEFRKGKLRVLVCTDILGRGIDIPSVSHVVVYRCPVIEDYVHRIGRTARGQYGKGHALCLFEYWNKFPKVAEELVELLEASGQVVPEELRKIASEVEAGAARTEWDYDWR